MLNMETCLRGFSFMPEQKADEKLEYIESEELERTWKTTRRQRLKEREQRIWDEFVQEQDVLSSVCKDDPYQFLEQLPEACLKELMEIELQKMKKEREIENQKQQEQKGDGDSPRNVEEPPQQTVTFADVDGDDSDVIHILDDDNDDDDQSGPDEEAVNDSPGSPCTVREKFEDEKELSPVSPPLSPDKGSSKSSENVTNMIESSIYCAKVRDLRMKINEEIMAIVTTLESRNILDIDPEELVKMCRRSTEFCARFSRIYMYQLHRQIHDVKRNTNVSLPFARYTQFQSQMVRIVSLHQNLLQALQLFHKSTEQTGCVRDSAAMLRCVCCVLREASAAAAAVPAPPHCTAASGLYRDEVLISCDRLDEAINEYETKMSNYMNSTANTNSSRSKKSKCSKGKKSIGTWSKSGSKMKSVAESRLSMYSLDTLRVHPKSSSSKDNQSSGTGTSKVRGGVHARDETVPSKQTPRKSPRSRRPLMRDPHEGRPRGRRAPREADIRTMVEAVEACTSSHISREPSPHQSQLTPRRCSRNNTPRLSARPPNNNNTRNNATAAVADARSPRKLAASPRPKLRSISPRKARRTSPKPTQILKAAISSIKSSNPLATAESSQVQMNQVQMNPVSMIHCAKKETPRADAETVVDVPSVSVDSPRPSPRALEEIEKSEREKKKMTNPVMVPGGRCEVTRIVRQLCGGDAAGNRNERVSGAKNAQLLCINGSSPRQPSTPQLLRILEETIQKKVPKTLFQKSPAAKNTERFRLTFNIPERTAENLFLYRTKFVQHMLASPMYANSLVGKPWEMIGSISEQLIDELLLQCAEEMQLREVVRDLYQAETR